MQSIGYELTSPILEDYARRGHNRTLKFLLRHGVSPDALPSALRMAIRNNRIEMVEMLVEYMTPELRAESRACEIAVTMHDRIEYLIYFMTNGFHWDLTTMNAAARAGNVEAVSFLRDNGCGWDVTTTAAAAGEDELACLTFLHTNNCPWDASTCTAALEEDADECLAYAMAAGCPHDPDLPLQVVYRGKVQCLRYLLESDRIPLSADLAEAAAQHVGPDFLILLRDKGCPWDERTCAVSSDHQHWQCFAYAYENGCPCDMNSNIQSRMYLLMGARVSDLCSDDETVRAAAVNDLITTAAKNPTCLYMRFVRDMGHSWSELFTTTASIHGSAMGLRYALTNGCPAPADLATIAAEHGQRDCLDVAVEFGYALTADVSVRMTQKKQLSCLSRVRELGGNLDACSTTAAAVHGDLTMLKFLHDNGAKWDEDTFHAAITHGHLNCVQYMFNNSCPIDFMNSITLAARHGHIELIQYLRERRLAWSTTTCAAAAEGGHTACLDYLRENGCPWDEETTMLASTQECFEYAVLMGCPNKMNNRYGFKFSG